ncbi:flagellar basal body-associated FliL family protein [Clostridium kluyveri]|uniref:Flagellar protein FliL n=1 Tax=Clostridium kluyveri TaxID=1534 RepID=A0A1L5F6A5_CLOKL|nr:flagellar basal body-associated FliL family protein [Clostridium kluyveri]APM38548.1 flagellar basal body protein FliL [Clostridium kluyveri]UZQ50846.1 flagellar basal body-associated FliL family protein [Clostridium kluyveri]
MENKEKKNGGVGLKVILIVFFLVAAVGAGVFFGYSKFLSDKNTNSNENMTTSNVTQTQTQTQSGESSSYLQHVVSAKTFDLSEFTINLADEDGKNYLKVNVYLGYDSKKLTDELTEKTPIIRDAIIEVLRTKKVEDINDKNMDNIKIEIIQRINPMLEKGKINNVYFSDILTQ